MTNLTSGQKWVLACMLASVLTVGATFFLEGDVRTFSYVVIATGLGAYAVIRSKAADKPKNN